LARSVSFPFGTCLSMITFTAIAHTSLFVIVPSLDYTTPRLRCNSEIKSSLLIVPCREQNPF
jgi:hypothetical protein